MHAQFRSCDSPERCLHIMRQMQANAILPFSTLTARANVVSQNFARNRTAYRHPRRCLPAMPAASMNGRQAIREAFSEYKKSFPDVDDISPAELDSMQQSATANLVVVDVRTPEEQQVSMLQGAVTHQKFQPEAHRDKLIVTYCTAGLRSGKYAARLQQQGYQVKNLHGSLVSWAHEGLPLYQSSDGREVKRLHAYGQQWADMVDGSGYETVVFQRPMLKGAVEVVKGLWPFG